MANAPAFDDAVECARANPNWASGVTLFWQAARPLLHREKFPHWSTRMAACRVHWARLSLRVSYGAIRAEDIDRELRAQIGKIRAAGIEPTHLDTHKHTHAHPRVMKCSQQVAQDLGITRVRKPAEYLRDSWRMVCGESGASPKQLAAVAAVRLLSANFDSILKKHGLRSPDTFLGVAATGLLGAERLCHLIDTLPKGEQKSCCTRASATRILARTGSRLQRQRQLELDGLLARRVRRAIEHHRRSPDQLPRIELSRRFLREILARRVTMAPFGSCPEIVSRKWGSVDEKQESVGVLRVLSFL